MTLTLGVIIRTLTLGFEKTSLENEFIVRNVMIARIEIFIIFTFYSFSYCLLKFRHEYFEKV